STRRVKGDVRIQQKGDIVAPKIQIAFVNFGHPGESIEIFDDGRLRIVLKSAIFAENDARNLIQRFPHCEIANRVIKLALYDKVDRLRGAQAFLRLDRDWRADKGDVQLRIEVLHHLGYLHIDVKTRSGRKKDE